MSARNWVIVLVAELAGVAWLVGQAPLLRLAVLTAAAVLIGGWYLGASAAAEARELASKLDVVTQALGEQLAQEAAAAAGDKRES